MNKSKKSVSTQENPDQGSNPAIKALVESVGSHVSDSDKDTLAELISFGDKRKAEGEKMEKEWWRFGGTHYGFRGKGDKQRNFSQRCIEFDRLRKIRMKKEEKNLKVLFSNDMMEGYLLDKYIEEYLYKWILYYPSDIDKEILGRKEVKGYDAVLAYLRAGNMEPGVVIDLGYENIGLEGTKEIVEALKIVGLAPGVKMNLWNNNIGDDGAKEIAELIKVLGLAPGVTLDLRGNRIGPDGAKYLVEAIKTVGLVPGVQIILSDNEIGDLGAQLIAEVILEIGIALGVTIDLRGSRIGDLGAQSIVDAIKQKGLPYGAKIELKNKSLSPEMKEQLSELNRTVKGKITFA